MADNVISPNMGLVIPLVGQEAGPQYAQDINTSMFTVDAHDHTPGNGVQITPSGMNINGTLDFNSNNIGNLRSARFTAQVAPIAAVSPDINNVYVSGVDLYYNDGSGNQVRITQGGGIAGSPGSITGLASPASASYNSGTGTFIWQQDTNQAANMDMASIIIRKTTASSPGITISAPSGLGSNYSIALPSALPASQKFVTLDNSGNLAANWAVDGSTLEVSSNSVQIKNSGVTTAKINDGAVTHVKLGALGQQISASSGANTFPVGVAIISANNVDITTSGRPVMLMLQWDGGSGNNSEVTLDATGSGGNSTLIITIQRDGATDVTRQIFRAIPGQFNSISLGAIALDPIGAGTYNYRVVIQVLGVGTTTIWNYLTLVAYEVG